MLWVQRLIFAAIPATFIAFFWGRLDRLRVSKLNEDFNAAAGEAAFNTIVICIFAGAIAIPIFSIPGVVWGNLVDVLPLPKDLQDALRLWLQLVSVFACCFYQGATSLFGLRDTAGELKAGAEIKKGSWYNSPPSFKALGRWGATTFYVWLGCFAAMFALGLLALWQPKLATSDNVFGEIASQLQVAVMLGSSLAYALICVPLIKDSRTEGLLDDPGFLIILSFGIIPLFPITLAKIWWGKPIGFYLGAFIICAIQIFHWKFQRRRIEKESVSGNSGT